MSASGPAALVQRPALNARNSLAMVAHARMVAGMRTLAEFPTATAQRLLDQLDWYLEGPALMVRGSEEDLVLLQQLWPLASAPAHE